MSCQSSLSASPTKAPRPYLSLPPEIRLKIYPLLFYCDQPLLVTPTRQVNRYRLDSGEWISTSPPCQLQMVTFRRPDAPRATSGNGLRLSSQLLRVCRQVYTEALPFLYDLNIFECSVRSWNQSVPRVISTPNFKLIRHLVVDYTYVKDFLSLLVQEDQVAATRGLEVLELRNWPTSAGRAFSVGVYSQADGRLAWYPPMRSHEPRPSADPVWQEHRLYQNLMEICQNHPRLRHIVRETIETIHPEPNPVRQRRRRRLLEFLLQFPELELPPDHDPDPEPEGEAHVRVTWRLVTEDRARDLKDNEVLVDLERELVEKQQAERDQTERRPQPGDFVFPYPPRFPYYRSY